jgi:hypothetical protein
MIDDSIMLDIGVESGNHWFEDYPLTKVINLKNKVKREAVEIPLRGGLS